MGVSVLIKMPATPLPDQAANALTALQREINKVSSYSDRRAQAQKRFEGENRRGNIIFDAVRATLASMCSGACRCMYCEDSAAGEIDHFRPKSLFPDLVFVWLNYLYACGSCNRTKTHRFRISLADGNLVDLVHPRQGQATEPQEGSAVLIDPRVDDPMEFLMLDLIGKTLQFMPRHKEGTLEYSRAEYTIECLKLNARDYLLFARQEAYETYCARLCQYVSARNSPSASRIAAAITRCGHPTVWAEMKSQAHQIPELKRLFENAPEALNW